MPMMRVRALVGSTNKSRSHAPFPPINLAADAHNASMRSICLLFQSFNRLLLNRRVAFTVLLLWVLAFSAHAQTPMPSAESLRLFVEREATGITNAAMGAEQLRLEVTLGQLDQRLQLAACAHVEPFVPSGVRLWGRAHIGLRCVEGARWSVLLPVTVRVFGPAWVATQPLAPQTQPEVSNLAQQEVEWSREVQGVVTELTQLEGRVLTRPIGIGQAIPLAALRAQQVIQQGDPVKLVGQGRGFAVSADAIALSSAVDGQSVRVKTESGRVVTGTARSGRRVDVAF